MTKPVKISMTRIQTTELDVADDFPTGAIELDLITDSMWARLGDTEQVDTSIDTAPADRPEDPRPDHFVILEGGLITNTPDVAVIDLDALDTEVLTDDDIEFIASQAALARRIGLLPIARRLESFTHEYSEGLDARP